MNNRFGGGRSRAGRSRPAQQVAPNQPVPHMDRRPRVTLPSLPPPPMDIMAYQQSPQTPGLNEYNLIDQSVFRSPTLHGMRATVYDPLCYHCQHTAGQGGCHPSPLQALGLNPAYPSHLPIGGPDAWGPNTTAATSPYPYTSGGPAPPYHTPIPNSPVPRYEDFLVRNQPPSNSPGPRTYNSSSLLKADWTLSSESFSQPKTDGTTSTSIDDIGDPMAEFQQYLSQTIPDVATCGGLNGEVASGEQKQTSRMKSRKWKTTASQFEGGSDQSDVSQTNAFGILTPPDEEYVDFRNRKSANRRQMNMDRARWEAEMQQKTSTKPAPGDWWKHEGYAHPATMERRKEEWLRTHKPSIGGGQDRIEPTISIDDCNRSSFKTNGGSCGGPGKYHKPSSPSDEIDSRVDSDDGSGSRLGVISPMPPFIPMPPAPPGMPLPSNCPGSRTGQSNGFYCSICPVASHPQNYQGVPKTESFPFGPWQNTPTASNGQQLAPNEARTTSQIRSFPLIQLGPELRPITSAIRSDSWSDVTTSCPAPSGAAGTSLPPYSSLFAKLGPNLEKLAQRDEKQKQMVLNKQQEWIRHEELMVRQLGLEEARRQLLPKAIQEGFESADSSGASTGTPFSGTAASSADSTRVYPPSSSSGQEYSNYTSVNESSVSESMQIASAPPPSPTTNTPNGPDGPSNGPTSGK